MKIKESWVNLTKIDIEKGENRMMKLSETNVGRIFRIDNDINDIEVLDQIILNDDSKYYICFEINKEIEEGLDRAPEYELKFITLNDYYIYQFHSILDNEYLSWQEKPEMIRDLSNEVSKIFSNCKINEIKL